MIVIDLSTAPFKYHLFALTVTLKTHFSQHKIDPEIVY